MNLDDHIAQLRQFRQSLYEFFCPRRDKQGSAWAIPMTGARVSSFESPIAVGIPLQQVQPIDKHRFILEHSLRLMKQRLLLSAVQIPSVEHEQNWFTLVTRVACLCAIVIGSSSGSLFSSTLVARSAHLQAEANQPNSGATRLSRIIQQLGTPARVVKLRGNSPGRSLGQTSPPRPVRPLIQRVQ